MKPTSYYLNSRREDLELEREMKEQTVYYFAYGSNMSRRQMRQRCKKSEYVGPARLQDWELKERTFADVDRHSKHNVHGIAWKVTKNCQRSLDLYEGVRSGLYERVWDYITLEDGERVLALIYTETKETKKHRSKDAFSLSYVALCTESALDCGIPVAKLYRERLKAYGELMGEDVDIRRHALNW